MSRRFWGFPDSIVAHFERAEDRDSTLTRAAAVSIERLESRLHFSYAPASSVTPSLSDRAASSATFATSSAEALPPVQLAIQAPSTAAPGAVLSPAVTVTVEDANGDTVVGDNSVIFLAIATGPVKARLDGTFSVQAVNGVATFTNLSLSKGGVYTLLANNGALPSATSSPITVTAPSTQLLPKWGRVNLPVEGVAGGKIDARVAVVVGNQMSAYRSDLTINFYVSTGTTLDGNQVLLRSLTKRVGFERDRNQATTFILHINALPRSLAAGNYHVLAQLIDPSGAPSVMATPQTMQVVEPIITPVVSVGNVTPASVAAGQSASLLVTVTNYGNSVAGGIAITLSPSADGATPMAGIILDSIRSSAMIRPNKSETFVLHFQPPDALAAGSYYPYVSVTLARVVTTKVGTTQFTVQ